MSLMFRVVKSKVAVHAVTGKFKDPLKLMPGYKSSISVGKKILQFDRAWNKYTDSATGELTNDYKLQCSDKVGKIRRALFSHFTTA